MPLAQHAGRVPFEQNDQDIWDLDRPFLKGSEFAPTGAFLAEFALFHRTEIILKMVDQ